MPIITKPNQHFDAVLYSGNNGTQNIPVGFQPDFIWSKCRNVGRSHRIVDSVRGLSYQLFSDSTDGGNTYDGTSYVSSITSTSSSGFAVTNAGADQYNTSGENYVSWTWKAGGTAVTNTSGSISSQVSVNTTAGFSIVTYTGNSSSAATVGHGLGVKPDFIVIKSRDESIAWMAWHSALSTQLGYLNLTDAFDGSRYSWALSSTQPTSSLITLGDQSASGYSTNRNNYKFVAYCFAQVAGYSAFGSYTGNGSSDGPFVYTGFRPKFIMVKCTSNAENWYIGDGARQTFNASTNPFLNPNLSDAESNSYAFIDLTSNGFKCRFNGADTNGSGRTYIYAAFAEASFKYANAR